MDKDLASKAVVAALKGDWGRALAINKALLQKNKDDIEALNRLARAYAELGKISKARETSKRAIKIDPFNTIALKSLKRWKDYGSGEQSNTSEPSPPQVFLEEPGKTKIVPLLHLGNPKTIASINSGDQVRLNTRSHRISVCTRNGKFIGRLSDDLSAHLKKLMSYGNEYQAFVKSVEPKSVKIFIRETNRSDKLKNIPSFTPEKIDYVSFTPPELVHKNAKTGIS